MVFEKHFIFIEIGVKIKVMFILRHFFMSDKLSHFDWPFMTYLRIYEIVKRCYVFVTMRHFRYTLNS